MRTVVTAKLDRFRQEIPGMLQSVTPMVADSDGDWVRFRDVETLWQQLEAAQHDMQDLLKVLKVYAHCRHGSIDCFCVKEARAELWID